MARDPQHGLLIDPLPPTSHRALYKGFVFATLGLFSPLLRDGTKGAAS